jgi:hypothetical protein
MYPHERSLVKRLEGEPFALIGINSDDSLEDLKKVLVKENITWRSWQNERPGKASIAKEWNVSSWPTIYVLDHEGVIRFKGVRGEAMDVAVDSLLAEMSAEH